MSNFVKAHVFLFIVVEVRHTVPHCKLNSTEYENELIGKEIELIDR